MNQILSLEARRGSARRVFLLFVNATSCKANYLHR
jgi:hypothetical protein